MINSTPIPDGFKRCSKCNDPFPNTAAYFYRSKIHRDGLNPKCKMCHNTDYRGKPMRYWPPQSNDQRFASDLSIPNEQGDMLWTGTCASNGYGQFSVNGIQVLAHRYAWELFYGVIPNGLFVCHTCDIKLCCNPTHLFLGTDLDNIADMIAKGRNSKGVDRWNARFTPETVREARRLYATGLYTYQQVGASFNVSAETVFDAVAGRTWKHVLD